MGFEVTGRESGELDITRLDLHFCSVMGRFPSVSGYIFVVFVVLPSSPLTR